MFMSQSKWSCAPGHVQGLVVPRMQQLTTLTHFGALMTQTHRHRLRRAVTRTLHGGVATMAGQRGHTRMPDFGRRAERSAGSKGALTLLGASGHWSPVPGWTVLSR